MDAAGNHATLVKIRHIGRTVQKGFYAPLVDHGRVSFGQNKIERYFQLFVNGLAVSCYAESSESILVQSMKDHIVSCDRDSFEVGG